MPYKVCVDDIERKEWEKQAKGFADYSIYQTWPYQQVRGEMDDQEISRVLIKDDSGQAMLMAHVRIKRIKPLGLRIGYVQWGPLIRGLDGKLRCSIQALDAFRRAYVGTRVNVLRIVPNVRNDEISRDFSEMLVKCGFRHVKYALPYRTFALWVGDSEEGIRERLHKSFRRDLRYGQKAGVQIRQGHDESLFETLEKLYDDAKLRKGFTGVDLQQFTKPQHTLSCDEKMKVLAAYHEGEPVAAYLASDLGDTCLVLVVACDEKAFACFASYVLWYQGAVSACKTGMKWCDLGGIDPDENRNVYLFKSRMAPKDICYIGAFEAYSSLCARLMWYVPGKIHSLTRSR
ncbi:MAG: peptidoglycan bridge formation glycyltransferase FemA/FemB family protein [Sedimentisphaerales bacterium]|jgi:lipid II:glycine glycyltransferase (peptidoglycan interpeptide bridge formation enzyme)